MARSKLRPPVGFGRSKFRGGAKKVVVSLDGIVIGDAVPKTCKTGSMGWHLSTKMQVKVGDYYVWVQMGVQLTIIGSKDLPLEPSGVTLAGGPPCAVG